MLWREPCLRGMSRIVDVSLCAMDNILPYAGVHDTNIRDSSSGCVYWVCGLDAMDLGCVAGWMSRYGGYGLCE